MVTCSTYLHKDISSNGNLAEDLHIRHSDTKKQPQRITTVFHGYSHKAKRKTAPYVATHSTLVHNPNIHSELQIVIVM